MPKVPDRAGSSHPSFGGLRVLVAESRRAREMAALVTTYGGEPLSAPAMREVPLASNTEAVAFADGLSRGDFDLVVLLTGVGTRALVAVVEAVRGDREAFLAALRRTRVVARGPKPVAVLRELEVPVWMTAPEPNTWRELLAALDARRGELALDGLRVAVQEYGVANPELLAGLESRGARVTRVPVYQWALPEDLEPLRAAIRAVTAGGNVRERVRRKAIESVGGFRHSTRGVMGDMRLEMNHIRSSLN
jgi:uroporphyrinogen-III synthase